MILLNYRLLIRDLVYQLCIKQFVNFPVIILQEPLNISECVAAAKSTLDDITEAYVPMGIFADPASYISSVLYQHRELLNKYFSIQINARMEIVGLPEIIPMYSPSPVFLPQFLVRLAIFVDWENELNCFQAISIELADYYSQIWRYPRKRGISEGRFNMLVLGIFHGSKFRQHSQGGGVDLRRFTEGSFRCVSTMHFTSHEE
jgi:hypothetical protein